MNSEVVNISIHDDQSETMKKTSSSSRWFALIALTFAVVVGTVLVVSQIPSYEGFGRTISNYQTIVSKPVIIAKDHLNPPLVANAVTSKTMVLNTHFISKAATPTYVQTVAGNGVNSSPVDEAKAVGQPGGTPRDIIFDTNNNLYYTDDTSHTIRVVSATTGITDTYAGTWGASGYWGDTGLATDAGFNYPFGLSWDVNGNMVVADVNAHVIRRIITSSKIINRVAGTGAAGYTGDQLYSTASALSSPYNAVSDGSGNLYVSDFGNCRIRKVLASNSIMQNFAGTGTCNAGTDGLNLLASNFYNPTKISIDPNYGYLLVPEWNAHRVRKINFSTGVVTTVAGTTTAGYIGDGMAATSSRLYYPRKVLVDSNGGYYIADHYNHAIRYVDGTTGIISTVFGVPSAAGFNQDGLDPTLTNIYYPESAVLDRNGALVVADVTNYRVRGAYAKAPTFAPTRSPTAAPALFVQTIVGTGGNLYPVDGMSANSVGSGFPYDLLFDASNNLIYSDGKSNTVRIVYAATGKTYTYAGTYRNSDFNGDNGPATSASFGTPFGLSWDLNGNILVTDTTFHNVRKITVSGSTISKVAGGSTTGYSGDQLFATASLLNTPHNAVVDGSGNIYISDFNNCRIRMVSTSNYMYNWAGTGTCSSSADGTFRLNSNFYYLTKMAFGPSYTYLYVPEWTSHRLRRITMASGIVTTVAGQSNSYGYTGDGGFATDSKLYYPRAVKVDSTGGLIISDHYNHAVRYVSAAGLITTLIGGNGAGFNQDGLNPLSTRINYPESAIFDKNGFLVVSDSSNYRIRGVYSKIPTGAPSRSPTFSAVYYVQTVVGTGANAYPIDSMLATATPAGTPRDIIFDSKNNLYYTDDKSNTIRCVNSTTGITTTFAGSYRVSGNGGDNGPLLQATFGSPFGLSWDNAGNMLVTDTTYHVVRKINVLTKIVSKVAGTGAAAYSGTAIIATNSALNIPHNAVADSSGNIYISDNTNCRIRRVINVGVYGYLYDFAGTGSCSAGEDGLSALNSALYYPTKIAFNSATTVLYVPEWTAHRVRQINVASRVVMTVAGTGTAGYTGDGGLGVNARLYYPRAVKVDASGGVYISDHYNHAIRYVSSEGLISTVVGGVGAGFNQDGTSPLATKIYYPESTGLDKNGYLYVLDTSNYLIRGVFASFPTSAPSRSPTGYTSTATVRTIAGTGVDGFVVDETSAVTVPAGHPTDVVFDVSNNMYYGDDKSNTVRVVYTATGLTYTFAGTYRVSGNSGDRDAATSARLSSPWGLNWNLDGNLIVVDNTNHVVRQVDMTSLQISRLAGTGSAAYTGENLPATISALNNPWSALPDKSGSIYISEYGNCRIRKLTASVLNTFAGTGTCSASDDGLFAMSSNFYNLGRINFDNSFNNMYVCEYNSHRVRKISMASMVVTTVVGVTNSAGYTGDGGLAINAKTYTPVAVSFDSLGGIFVTEWNNHAVRYITPEGIISTVIGGIGAGFNQDNLAPSRIKLYNPSQAKLDTLGNLIITDYSNFRVRGIFKNAPTSAPTRFPTKDPLTYTVFSVAGTGATTVPVDGSAATSVPGGYPRDLVFDSSNNLYYADAAFCTVRVVYASTGLTYTFAGLSGTCGNSGEGVAATNARLNLIFGLNFDNNGNLLLAEESAYSTIRRVTMSSKIINTVAGTGTAGYNGEAFPATSSQLNNPHNAITDLSGNIYISDYANCRIRMVQNSDKKMYTWGGTGTCASSNDGLTALASNFYGVLRITFNSDYSYLYLCEFSSHRVRKIHMTSGIVTTVAGTTNSAGFSGDGGFATNAQIYYPRKVVFDQDGGFFLSDQSNQVIRYVSVDGMIGTYAGVPGVAGFNQDGTWPLATRLNGPDGIALDSKYYLYIADLSNYRIRQVYSNKPFTNRPSASPTLAPSALPSLSPTLAPTAPTAKPTVKYTPSPTRSPTV